LKGEAKNKKEVALRLIKKGMTNAEIAEITDLPINTVAELRLEATK
jgi:DNA-binding CsgD family transcriptional regulator